MKLALFLLLLDPKTNGEKTMRGQKILVASLLSLGLLALALPGCDEVSEDLSSREVSSVYKGRCMVKWAWDGGKTWMDVGLTMESCLALWYILDYNPLDKDTKRSEGDPIHVFLDMPYWHQYVEYWYEFGVGPLVRPQMEVPGSCFTKKVDPNRSDLTTVKNKAGANVQIEEMYLSFEDCVAESERKAFGWYRIIGRSVDDEGDIFWDFNAPSWGKKYSGKKGACFVKWSLAQDTPWIPTGLDKARCSDLILYAGYSNAKWDPDMDELYSSFMVPGGCFLSNSTGKQRAGCDFKACLENTSSSYSWDFSSIDCREETQPCSNTGYMRCMLGFTCKLSSSAGGSMGYCSRCEPLQGCALSCPYGFHYGDNGCEICECM
jgi:hypothetical protein